jgi:16S rRNA G966 N2-methylase RsmD
MEASLLKRIEHDYIRPILRIVRPSLHASFGGIDITYREELDGGGTTFGQDFLPYLRARGIPRQRRIFEWCSGPGFIGFSLLGNGFCETLCLSDINSAAVSSCRNTMRINNLADRVSIYKSNVLRDIPASEKWNLVVSNPPHFIDKFPAEIRAHDPGWRIHREFFRSIAAFLAEHGVVVLQENNHGSTLETFRPMIEDAGLKIVFADGDSPELTSQNVYYYVGIMRRDEAPSPWATTRVERMGDPTEARGWRRID